jgi:uncharacterized Ntn-hydrolase superfamily protein
MAPFHARPLLGRHAAPGAGAAEPDIHLVVLRCQGNGGGEDAVQDRRPRRRLGGTYSITATDDSGSFGVAVQSHWFNVGAVVPWVEAGLGAVAVQSISDPATGRRALDGLRSGSTAESVLEGLLAGDDDAAYRQIAIVDGRGNVAAHTGELCIAEAGHHTGDGFSAQANIMDRSTVWTAMAEAFERETGDLADRLLAALDAAEAEGGDLRGRQSAALVVVDGGTGGVRFDLRVEDATDPLGELRRLVALQRAYLELNRGDAMMARGEFEGALTAYERAAGLVPDQATGGEAAFWTGVAFATTGRTDRAIPFLVRAADVDDRWARLLPRLVGSELFPDDQELLDRLLDAMGR